MDLYITQGENRRNVMHPYFKRVGIFSCDLKQKATVILFAGKFESNDNTKKELKSIIDKQNAPPPVPKKPEIVKKKVAEKVLPKVY
jgi:hypothetical protein